MTWLKALLAEAALSVWWIVSALSTAATFFVPSLSGKPRFALAFSTVVGFAWANFRVFQKQEARIMASAAELERREVRVSRLKIVIGKGSRYMLSPVGSQRNADFAGGHFEFCLRVENEGQKNSIVDRYEIEVLDLGRQFAGLKPQEGYRGVQGRHSQHGLSSERSLSRTGIIRIASESATDNGTLFFYLPDLTLEQFVNAGMKMHGDQRKFGPLHCRLTLTDTTASTATAEFEMPED